MPSRTDVLRLFGIAMVVAAGVGGGCSSDPPAVAGGGVGLLADATTEDVEADYDDIDSAVAVAASKNEMAVIWSNGVTDSPRKFYLRTVKDEPVYLFIGRQPSFERPAPRDPKDPKAAKPGEQLVMRCTVGRWGDSRREEDLLEAVQKRLEELKGRDFAPIR